MKDETIVYPFDHEHMLNHSSFTTKLLRYIAYNPRLKNDYFPHFKDIDLSRTGVVEQVHVLGHLLQITPIRSIVLR